MNRFLNSFTVTSVLIVLAASGLAAFVWLSDDNALLSNAKPSSSVSRKMHGVRTNWANESTCIDCHEQATDFWETGHARTLTRANDAEMLRKLLQLNSSRFKDDGVSVETDQDEVSIRQATPGLVTTASVDWCFGSGTHANTWVTLLTDSLGSVDLLELRWTHFTGTEDFGITPGHPDVNGKTSSARLGLLFDGPRARRCFNCHASMPDEHLDLQDFDVIHPGVTCQRCHGPRADHVASEGALNGELNNSSLSSMNRDEAVAMCAECHRRAEDQLAEAVTPDNVDIVRFQPVGLANSKCFIGTELSCVSCHNPHQPLRMQDSLGDWQCRQCHESNTAGNQPVEISEAPAADTRIAMRRHAAGSGSECSAGQDQNCVSCHMPKISTAPGLKFTDHWIRIRREGQPPE